MMYVRPCTIFLRLLIMLVYVVYIIMFHHALSIQTIFFIATYFIHEHMTHFVSIYAR